jgi:hypothetical protein
MRQELLKKHLDDLRAGDLESQVKALDALAVLVSEITAMALNAFSSREESDDWVLLDRLLLLATQIKSGLQQFFSKTADPRKRRLAAIALIEMGDIDVAPTLLDAIEHDPGFYALAANKLGNKRIYEAIPSICRRLRTIPVEETLGIVGLLAGLRKLTDVLPDDIGERLRIGNEQPEIDAALSEFKTS